jgi:DNA polymerase I-like protein with 3'-5' exonuclease and polymerase domains
MQDKFTFITTRKDHAITKGMFEIADTIKPLLDYLDTRKKFKQETGYDTENSSLNPLTAVQLLSQFGDEENVFIVDRTCIDNEFLLDYTDINWLGVNLQYDYCITAHNEGKAQKIKLPNLTDLMIIEQCIGRGIRRSNSLEGMHLRRLGVQYPEDKQTGKTFINKKKNIRFVDQQITYAGTDIKVLPKIFNIQKELIAQCHLEKRIYDIAFPYISILGDKMLNGSYLNREKWAAIYHDNKRLKFTLEQRLDNQIKALGYRVKDRKQAEIILLDLFGAAPAEITNKNLNNINYNSTDQVLEIFRHFNLPVPMFKDPKTHILGQSTRIEALEQYNIDNYSNPLREFIKILVDYKGVIKRINSFGLAFMHEIYPDPANPGAKNNLIRGFYNPTTDKVHTKYKQEFTANGRTSSGSDNKSDGGKQKSKKKKNSDVFFNSQNMPKEPRYREPFEIELALALLGWVRLTLDLAGAELIILGALSGDKKLLELQAQDLHSYISTKGFNNIIKYIRTHMDEKRARQELYDVLKVNKVFEIIAVEDRAGNFIRFHTEEEKHQLTLERVELAYTTGEFLINKKTAKDIRDTVKNGVYASFYGANGDRMATTLSTSKLYGEIVLDTIKAEFPVAFSFLRRVAQTAINEGYVVFNTRTNSRHIFNEFLEARKYGKELTNAQKSKIARDAMNYIISGTQADMIKEAQVEVTKLLKEVDVGYKWIFQVHDEFIIDIQTPKIVPAIKQKTLDVCNLYLNGMAKMGANEEVLLNWTK